MNNFRKQYKPNPPSPVSKGLKYQRGLGGNPQRDKSAQIRVLDNSTIQITFAPSAGIILDFQLELNHVSKPLEHLEVSSQVSWWPLQCLPSVINTLVPYIFISCLCCLVTTMCHQHTRVITRASYVWYLVSTV
jgi:hypothetical protein